MRAEDGKRQKTKSKRQKAKGSGAASRVFDVALGRMKLNAAPAMPPFRAGWVSVCGVPSSRLFSSTAMFVKPDDADPRATPHKVKDREALQITFVFCLLFFVFCLFPNPVGRASACAGPEVNDREALQITFAFCLLLFVFCLFPNPRAGAECLS